MTDDFQTLIRAARQVIDTERALAGDALPADRPALPEIETPTGASSSGERAPLERSAAMTIEQKTALLDELAQQVAACTQCPLHAGRTQTVYGAGSPDADLMFIGEGPGAEEDAQGLPFVGRSGQLLTKMIEAVGLTREKVYIANVVKCRPPSNRTPGPDEAAACWGYLQRQIEIIEPKVIVVLGNAATKALLDTKVGITKLRGQWREVWGIPVMPTFHPAYLLRQYTVENRRRVWSDLKAAVERLA